MKAKKAEKKNEIVGKINLKDFWVKTWKLLAPSHKHIMQVAISIFFIEALNLVGPYILKVIIDKITTLDVSQFGPIVLLVGAMLLISQTISIVDFLFTDGKIFTILADMTAYLYNNALHKMIFLDLNYHERENTGGKVVKISRGVDKINNLFGSFFWEVLPTIFQIIFTAIVLLWVNWVFLLLVSIFVPIFVFLTLKINRGVYPLRVSRYDSEEEAAGIMAQSIININTVKSFVQERQEYRKFKKATEKVKNVFNLEYGQLLRYNWIRNIVIDLGRASILFFGVYLVIHGKITVGSLVFVYTISEKALLSLYRISRLYDRIMESADAVERLYDLNLEEPEIKNPERGIRPENVRGAIEFRNVSYSYHESNAKALDNVNLKISSGCVTALVGPSGGGKTTVVRMIYRHYDPDKGAVLLDGRDLREYDLYGFRKFISIVPQEVEMFNTTICENIAYAKANASMTEIRAAARIANAEEFITNLKDSYDTIVGERGIKLSGGQRQRIGIARAILANPRILIFDEATSSLDSYSEKLIQDAMEKISKNRTVIIIAHRLSTIQKADKIVVLEHGRVAEVGSHTELSQLEGGLYQKLINLQKVGDVG